MNLTKLASDTLALLRAEGMSLATAESLTGGMVGAAFTAIPGSSDTYRGGIISYTDEVKMKLLGVPAEAFGEMGAVSEPVARAMAEGTCKAAGADVGVSTTGLAGPGGDEYGNPVGTVWIGVCVQGRTAARKYLFEGNREAVRAQATEEAILLVMMTLAEMERSKENV